MGGKLNCCNVCADSAAVKFDLENQNDENNEKDELKKLTVKAEKNNKQEVPNDRNINQDTLNKISKFMNKENVSEISKFKIFKKLVVNKYKIINEKVDTVIIQGKLKREFENSVFKDIYLIINKEKLMIYKSKEAFMHQNQPIEIIYVNDLQNLSFNNQDAFTLTYLDSNKELKTAIIHALEKGQFEEYVAVIYFIIVFIVYSGNISGGTGTSINMSN